jgi:gliding motility-associated-like protein
MKLSNLFLIVTAAALTELSQVNAQSIPSDCPNADFESGNFSNWQGKLGSCCPVATPNNGIVPGRQTIISSYGTDPNTCNQLQIHPAFTGGKVCRLGNDNTGSESEQLIYPLVVDSNNALFVYRYAVVLEDPGHTPNLQPNFRIRVLNSAGNVFDPVCGQYYVQAASNIPGFQTCNEVRWKDWATVGLDLSPYMGQSVRLEFTTSDCGLGGHYGYAYLDCFCMPLQIATKYCLGSNVVQLDAPPGFSYLWSTGDTTPSITIHDPVNGSIFSCNLTTVTGCNLTLSAKLLPATVYAGFVHSPNLCSMNIQFTDTSVVLNSFISSWHWDFGDGSPIDTSQNPLHTYANAGSYDVTLIVKSYGGCADTITLSSLLIRPPFISGSNVNSNVACHGDSTGAAYVMASGGTFPYNYTWSPGGGSQSYDNNLPAGAYTVSMTDAYGCTTVQNILITEPPQLLLSTTGVKHITCNGGNDGAASVLAAGGVSPYRFTWSPSIGTTSSVGSLTADIYVAMVTDSNGCAASQTIQVTQPLPVTAFLAGDPYICTGFSDTLTASVLGGTPPYNYLWSTGSSNSSIVVAPLQAAGYSFSVTDVNGCPSPMYHYAVNVYPPITMEMQGNLYICLGQDVRLAALAAGGNAQYTYTWDNIAGSSQQVVVTPVTDSTFICTVTDGCSIPVQQQIRVHVTPYPVVSFMPHHINGCAPVAVQFKDSSSAVIGSAYQWKFGDGNSSSEKEPVHIYPNPGNYSVSLSISTPQNCISNLTLPVVHVAPSPDAKFVMSDTMVTYFEPTVMLTNNSLGATTWQWDFGDGAQSWRDWNASHQYKDTGNYTIRLIVNNNYGCQDTLYGMLRVVDDYTIFIPNSFTPNGDDVNDRFGAFALSVTGYDIWILNRWGQQVFHSSDLNTKWNGKYENNGRDCEEGVYIYRVRALDRKHVAHEYTGSVTLID